MSSYRDSSQNESYFCKCQTKCLATDSSHIFDCIFHLSPVSGQHSPTVIDCLHTSIHAWDSSLSDVITKKSENCMLFFVSPWLFRFASTWAWSFLTLLMRNWTWRSWSFWAVSSFPLQFTVAFYTSDWKLMFITIWGSNICTFFCTFI